MAKVEEKVALLAKYGIKYPVAGYYCPPGWEHIVEALIRDLQARGWDGDLRQVKEKFGGLRFYIGVGGKDLRHLVDSAETVSRSTCQKCGKHGKLENHSGIWATLCGTCLL